MQLDRFIFAINSKIDMTYHINKRNFIDTNLSDFDLVRGMDNTLYQIKIEFIDDNLWSVDLGIVESADLKTEQEFIAFFEQCISSNLDEVLSRSENYQILRKPTDVLKVIL